MFLLPADRADVVYTETPPTWLAKISSATDNCWITYMQHFNRKCARTGPTAYVAVFRSSFAVLLWRFWGPLRCFWGPLWSFAVLCGV